MMPTSFTQYGFNPATQTKLFVIELPSFQTLEHVAFPVKPGTIFIAADSREVSTDDIARVAERLLQQGLRYMCVWGPDCERVHDIFDEMYVGKGDHPYKFDMMTTCHDDESVGEALWFFLNCATVEENEMIGRASFAVRIGNPAGSAPISELIQRIEEFID
jgi:hypothetical protein